MMPAPLLALAALVPLVIGPLPVAPAELTGELCGGGTISIPLGNQGDETPDCPPAGCHAPACRERSKRGI
ncbi:MAG: hypothetical protein ACXIT4_06005 [Erythrobacter sp.]